MIPVPVLWEIRRCECKSGKMKTHPATTVLHVFFKSLSLRRIFRARIQENNHLVPGKKFRIQIIPVIGGIIYEIIGGSYHGKPAVGFVNKTDMCLVFPCGIKCN